MHFTRAFRFFLVATVASLLFTCQLRAQQGPPQLSETGPLSRISGPIVESDAVTLAGNTHPMARAEFDLGAIPDETRLERMVLLLQPDATQQAALDALVEAQQQSGSDLFRKWLSPEEYGNRLESPRATWHESFPGFKTMDSLSNRSRQAAESSCFQGRQARLRRLSIPRFIASMSPE